MISYNLTAALLFRRVGTKVSNLTGDGEEADVSIDNAEIEDTDVVITNMIRMASLAREGTRPNNHFEATALKLVSSDDENAGVNHEQDITTADDEQDQRHSEEDIEEQGACETSKQESYVSIKFNNEWFDTLVMSDQPKKTSVNKECMNMHAFGEVDPRSIYTGRRCRNGITLVHPRFQFTPTKHHESEQDAVYAKFKQLDNLKRNDVWEEVQFSGQPTVSPGGSSLRREMKTEPSG